MPKHFASFQLALYWVAQNESFYFTDDDGADHVKGPESIALLSSVRLVAFLWNRTPEQIALKVQRIRFAMHPDVSPSAQESIIQQEIHRPVTAKGGRKSKRSTSK